MLLLLTLLTAGYFVAVLWIRRTKRVAASARAGQGAATLQLPEADRPPVTDAGWPAEGKDLASYVDRGFAALDAYLSEGSAP